MKKDVKTMKHSFKKKKRKLGKDSEDGGTLKKLKLSTISATNWDLKSILSDPDTALEPLRNFLALQHVKREKRKESQGDQKEEEEEGGDEEGDDSKGGEVTDATTTDETGNDETANEAEIALETFNEACDAYIEASPEFVQLFAVLEKWVKKNSELKVALELFDVLLLRLLTRRQGRTMGQNQVILRHR